MTNDSELDKILIFLMQSDIKVGESIINHPSVIEATQAIQKLLNDRIIEARIDELCELTDKGFDIEANCREWAWTINQYTQKRLSKLKAQTVRGDK